MACTQKLARLGCNQLGVAFTKLPWNTGSSTIQLSSGGGAQFPVPTMGTSFWVDIDGCDCCARFEVTANANDVLHVRAPITACGCIPPNARVRYAHSSPEHVSAIVTEMGINVVAPLQYNCATRTLSINCEQLKALVASPCAT